MATHMPWQCQVQDVVHCSERGWPIVASHSHMCLLPCPASQDVYAWGFNSTGQLGLGDLKTRHSPVAITEQAVPSDEEVNKAAKVGGKRLQALVAVL